MKKTIILSIGALACMMLYGCRVTFPARSEASYQESVSAIKKELKNKGYNLVDFMTLSGSTDNDIYTFSNSDNETVKLTLAVERDSDPTNKFIKSVEIRGCMTSKSSDFDTICSPTGIVATTLINTKNEDIKGTRVDAGATIGGIIFFDLLVGIIIFALVGLGS